MVLCAGVGHAHAQLVRARAIIAPTAHHGEPRVTDDVRKSTTNATPVKSNTVTAMTGRTTASPVDGLVNTASVTTNTSMAEDDTVSPADALQIANNDYEHGEIDKRRLHGAQN